MAESEESEESRREHDRMIVLEEWMMHTDRVIADLHEVVCAMQNRLDEQNRILNTLKVALERLTLPGEDRSFEDERPPHY
ncbi:MAG: SlyX family protein [Pirellulaceae bacterium]